MLNVVSTLWTSNNMSPPRSDLGTRRNSNDGAVRILDVLVTRHPRIVHVLNRVVRARGPHALELPLFHAIDRDLLEDSVRSSRASQRGKEGKLHGYCGSERAVVENSCRRRIHGVFIGNARK